MNIYFTRHGETPWNKRHKLQGQVNIPLSEAGKEQARITAEGMKDIPFDIVFASPLTRARQTAEIIKGDRDIPIIFDDRLKEINFGVLEGRKIDTIMNSPKCIRAARFVKDPERYRAPKYGESMYDVRARFESFYKEVLLPLEAEGKYENILVAAHGCLIRNAITYLNDRPVAATWKTPFGANCATAIFSCVDGKTEMISESTLYYEEPKDVRRIGKGMGIL